MKTASLGKRGNYRASRVPVITAHGACGQVAAEFPPLSGSTKRSSAALSATRTTTLSVAPEESITVTREKPGPSGVKNGVPRPCAGTGLPLTRTVSGAPRR